ncbi:MAG: MMPL family transporter [Sulfurospirillaceae bacterium]|nr:MMPL family transporter [Sulfurospirillaceae bacterium]MDD2827549.1 MMPL family transporter [Sulfurospirillaceae bacterium]
MLKNIYQNLILKFPKIVLLCIVLLVAFLGYEATKLEIDASSETLLLEHDADLKFAKKVNQTYAGDDFLVIAYTPNGDLLSDTVIHNIKNLSLELMTLPRVKAVSSILNVPLLQSPPRPVKELVEDVLTLESPKVDKRLAKEEFLTSPLYSNNLVSNDFKTTALIVFLKSDETFKALEAKRNTLKDEEQIRNLNAEEAQTLKQLNLDFKAYRDTQRNIEHENILQIRTILKNYQSTGKLFLGGVNMIADDLVSFVKSDLILFGSILLALLLFVLWLIFRQLRWVVIPVIISLFSVVATAGILGLNGWEVTVISSNFVSLQLIITLSVILHLMVRYRELALKYPKSSHHRLILNTVLSKASPSFYAIITTVAGFSSLLLSGILPIINLGWMMSIGIAMSLILSFVIFPTIMILLPKLTPYNAFEIHFSPVHITASWVKHHGRKIIYTSFAILLLGISGSSLLIVENSFINYFKEHTAIYQGMKIIDQKLGGTTPLDIIVKFKTDEPKSSNEPTDEFEAEFEKTKNDAQYWFTPDKMEKIQQIHTYLESNPEIGKVQSLATMLEIGKMLNDNQPLDNFQLALLYNKLPDNYRKFILDPYVDIKNNEVRFTTRIVDSNPLLRRNELIKRLDSHLKTLITPDIGTPKLAGLMVLYNNMLQSLFFSQIVTLGFVIAIIWGMFIILFKSIKIASLALVANIVPMSTIFGFMGWFGIPLDMMTITIAAISIGIGVDDTIHYIHRFEHELKMSNGDYVEAMERSHNSIGYGMYYTSLAIMLGFFILVVSNFIPTIYFGLLTVLVMFTSLLAALLLLPKLLIIFKPFKR